MAHGRELIFSYMDGVPVKISEKYKPPRKVTLPVGFQQRISYESTNDEYDFRVEHFVLKNTGAWRSQRKAAIEERRERIQAHELAWREKLSEDFKKLTLNSGIGKFEKITPENVASSSKTQSHPTVSSTTSHNLAFPSPVSCTTSSSSSRDTCSNPDAPANSFDVASSYPSPSPSHQTVQYSDSLSVLKPVRISKVLSNVNSSKSSSNFNISDFEADTSSPFDNMELKTINDMEELAHVLQPISNSPDNYKNDSSRSDVVTDTFSPQSSFEVIQTSPSYCTVGPKMDKETIIPHMNGMTGFSFYRRENDAGSRSYVTVGHNLYDQPSTPRELGGMFSYYPQQPWTISVNPVHPESHHSSGNEEISLKVSSNISPEEGITFPEAVNSKTFTSDVSFPVTYSQQSARSEEPQTPSRSLSKSVPDIVQELEKELAEKRAAERNVGAARSSHTPPPRPSSFGSAGLEDWKPWPDLDSPEQSTLRKNKSPSKGERKKSSLPNPFKDLPMSSQHLVKHISEMGFSLPRVARACQLFGEDDKKVVEFLLQVQALEDQKWPGDMAEKALVLFPEVKEAAKYLEALTQLLDLGFPEDQVSEALVEFQNDRDKALDHLIS